MKLYYLQNVINIRLPAPTSIGDVLVNPFKIFRTVPYHTVGILSMLVPYRKVSNYRILYKATHGQGQHTRTLKEGEDTDGRSHGWPYTKQGGRSIMSLKI